jgi:hypothetical protein
MNALNVAMDLLKDAYVHVIDLIAMHPHATFWSTIAVLAITAWL